MIGNKNEIHHLLLVFYHRLRGLVEQEDSGPGDEGDQGPGQARYEPYPRSPELALAVLGVELSGDVYTA